MEAVHSTDIHGLDRRAIIAVTVATIITAVTVTVTLMVYIRQRPSECRDADESTGNFALRLNVYDVLCTVHSGNVAVRSRTDHVRTPVRIVSLPVRNVGHFVYPTLPHFAQLYRWST